jgi:hypothetical protein
MNQLASLVLALGMCWGMSACDDGLAGSTAVNIGSRVARAAWGSLVSPATTCPVLDSVVPSRAVVTGLVTGAETRATVRFDGLETVVKVGDRVPGFEVVEIRSGVVLRQMAARRQCSRSCDTWWVPNPDGRLHRLAFSGSP